MTCTPDRPRPPAVVLPAMWEYGVNTAAVVDHQCQLGDFAHVSANVVLGGGVSVGEGSLVGIGACVLPGVVIGAWSQVGAGAVVTRDVPDGVVAYGVPARVMGQVP